MANVSFYLDRRRARKDGTMPLRLTVRFNNKVVMVATDVRVEAGISKITEGQVQSNKSQRTLYIPNSVKTIQAGLQESGTRLGLTLTVLWTRHPPWNSMCLTKCR